MLSRPRAAPAQLQPPADRDHRHTARANGHFTLALIAEKPHRYQGERHEIDEEVCDQARHIDLSMPSWADAEMSGLARERLTVLRQGIERGRSLMDQLRDGCMANGVVTLGLRSVEMKR